MIENDKLNKVENDKSLQNHRKIKETIEEGNFSFEEEDNLLNEYKNEGSSKLSFSRQIPIPQAKVINNFKLRGDSINPIIDASTPLMGFMIRVQNLKSVENIAVIRNRVAEEIRSIERELTELKYDKATILAHRYTLCSAIDEFVMGSNLASDGYWSDNSLLSQFHNERWGGEKFFSILNRIMSESHHYLHVLEFMYMLLGLGFEGMYRVRHNGKEELRYIIEEVADIIKKHEEWEETNYTNDIANIYDKKYHIKTYRLPLLISLISLLALFGFWLIMTIKTNKEVNDVLAGIGQEKQVAELKIDTPLGD